MTPLVTQSLTLSTLGPGAMSGRLVPASTLIASWFASRTVVRWTLMPVWSWKGFKTSWNALSSAPPHAVQTVTSVDDGPWLLLPPDEQAAARSNAPSPRAIALELSFAKTSAIACSPPYPNPRPGSGMCLPVAFFPIPTGARVRRQQAYSDGGTAAKTNVRLSDEAMVGTARRVVNLRVGQSFKLRRMSALPRFPDGFLFGASISSYQTEGGNTNTDWWWWEHIGPTPRRDTQ